MSIRPSLPVFLVTQGKLEIDCSLIRDHVQGSRSRPIHWVIRLRSILGLMTKAQTQMATWALIVLFWVCSLVIQYRMDCHKAVMIKKCDIGFTLFPLRTAFLRWPSLFSCLENEAVFALSMGSRSASVCELCVCLLNLVENLEHHQRPSLSSTQTINTS